MNDIAIKIENLSKRYRIGLKDQIPETLVSALTSWLKSPLANYRQLRHLSHFIENGRDTDDIIWALKDISFKVKQGEVVGTITIPGAFCFRRLERTFANMTKMIRLIWRMVVLEIVGGNHWISAKMFMGFL